METRNQVSAGGVAFRRSAEGVEVALIRVGEKDRWQLPKGLVDPGESPETTAIREVREEAGIDTRLVAPLDVIEYWYVATERGQKIRYHKFVHFFLLVYVAGEVGDHDEEVLEARWVPAGRAVDILAFGNEKKVAERARQMIEEGALGDR